MATPGQRLCAEHQHPPWIAPGRAHCRSRRTSRPYWLRLPESPCVRERSVELLMSKPKLTFDDFVKFKFSNRSLLADRIMPDLLSDAASNDDPM